MTAHPARRSLSLFTITALLIGVLAGPATGGVEMKWHYQGNGAFATDDDIGPGVGRYHRVNIEVSDQKTWKDGKYDYFRVRLVAMRKAEPCYADTYYDRGDAMVKVKGRRLELTWSSGCGDVDLVFEWNGPMQPFNRNTWSPAPGCNAVPPGQWAFHDVKHGLSADATAWGTIGDHLFVPDEGSVHLGDITSIHTACS